MENCVVINDSVLKELFEYAEKAAKNSYSVYSKFPVGAAVLTENGKIFSGCNIENRSYGLTNCAERTAVFKAVSEGFRKIFAVAICAEKSSYPVAPCGACRQVLSEFCDGCIPVVFGNSFENSVIKTMAELYPFDSLHELSDL